MNKTWIINVQVNTMYLASNTNNFIGTWESPIGLSEFWGNHVRMSAICKENPNDVIIGNGDNFTLKVGKNDTIKWVVSEINPIYDNMRSVCMYGFSISDQEAWNKNLTPPEIVVKDISIPVLLNGFNAEEQPLGNKWMKISMGEISIPQTQVRALATSTSLQYYMKFLILDIENPNNPTVLNYIQIDPIINIVL